MKFVTLIGAFVAATALAGVARADEACKLGVSMYTLGAPYFAAQLKAAEAEGKKQGCTVRTADGQNDMVKQIGDIQDMVAAGVNVLIVNPRDPKGLIPAVDAATKEGVKVIGMDSLFDPSANILTNVSAANGENGKLVGAWLAKKMDGKPIKMALISGEQGNVVGQDRRMGVISGLMDALLTNYGHADVSIVGQGWGHWSTDGGLSAMEDLLTAHPDINVVLGENDSMVLGARKALKAANRLNGVLLVAAADGQKEALALIQKGEYGATGLNNPKILAEMAVDIGVKALNGKAGELGKYTFTPPVAITKDNVDKYYDPNSVF
ncbi:MAG: ABC transporter substrate-binding protein [Rhizobiaceae bacterium]|nr:MAG: ABC transporter substrate-binding protein [Rhizobiaceae bacterium]